MGIARIPFTAIYEYAKIYEVDDFDTFNYLIKVMDKKVIELADKESKSKEGNGTKSRKKRG